MSERGTTIEDVVDGVAGAARMLAAFVTPMLREPRSHWGATEEDAARTWPGDDLVPEPKWSWHHAIYVDAPAREVWRWVVQIGRDKAGFYSYEALENLAGCDLHNADRVHPEWQSLREGDVLLLHPEMRLPVRWVEEGHGFVAGPRVVLESGRDVPPGDTLPPRHLAGAWGFFGEPIGPDRCRFVSRYRVSYQGELAQSLQVGPLFVEPIGYVMDRRMLLGVKERAERAHDLTRAPN